MSGQDNIDQVNASKVEFEYLWPLTDKVINFERLGPCFWEYVTWGVPKAGDYYLSGAVITAYLSRAVTSTVRYHIVRPTWKAQKSSAWVRGDPVLTKED